MRATPRAPFFVLLFAAFIVAMGIAPAAHRLIAHGHNGCHTASDVPAPHAHAGCCFHAPGATHASTTPTDPENPDQPAPQAPPADDCNTCLALSVLTATTTFATPPVVPVVVSHVAHVFAPTETLLQNDSVTDAAPRGPPRARFA